MLTARQFATFQDTSVDFLRDTLKNNRMPWKRPRTATKSKYDRLSFDATSTFLWFAANQISQATGMPFNRICGVFETADNYQDIDKSLAEMILKGSGEGCVIFDGRPMPDQQQKGYIRNTDVFVWESDKRWPDLQGRFAIKLVCDCGPIYAAWERRAEEAGFEIRIETEENFFDIVPAEAFRSEA